MQEAGSRKQEAGRDELETGSDQAEIIKKRIVRRTLLEEHKRRVDLHIVQWALDAKDQLIQEHPIDLEKYKTQYLIPTLHKFGNKMLNEADKREVADYLVGSTIRLVVDLLGKGNCYVPDSENPTFYSQELLKQQLLILKIAGSDKSNSEAVTM